MPVFFYRGHISHCYNISASNWIQRFFKGLGTFAFTNYVKITVLVNNTRTFSSYFVILDRFYTPHSDLQYSAMNNHFCIPYWLPKETVQISDCNFDPAPPEILLFTAKRRRFKAFIKPISDSPIYISDTYLYIELLFIFGILFINRTLLFIYRTPIYIT